MPWIWQLPGWPDFRYDASSTAPLEQRFLLSSGEIPVVVPMSACLSTINCAPTC